MPEITELDALTAKNEALTADCDRLVQELEVAKRSTPSLEASQIEDAHRQLDRFDVAREMRGRVLLLGDRISEMKIDKSWYQLVRRAHAALDGCGCAREHEDGSTITLDDRCASMAKNPE